MSPAPDESDVIYLDSLTVRCSVEGGQTAEGGDTGTSRKWTTQHAAKAVGNVSERRMTVLECLQELSDLSVEMERSGGLVADAVECCWRVGRCLGEDRLMRLLLMHGKREDE